MVAWILGSKRDEKVSELYVAGRGQRLEASGGRKPIYQPEDRKRKLRGKA